MAPHRRLTVFKGIMRRQAMQDMYELILAKSKELDPMDFKRVRAYAFVLMCINTGTRNKEIRFAEVGDLDTRFWTFDIIHVKGEASYGLPRRVPIPPEVRPIITNWLLLRQKWLADNSLDSPALFPSKSSDDGFLSGNSLRVIKHVVEEDLGIKFDLRQCRRTGPGHQVRPPPVPQDVRPEVSGQGPRHRVRERPHGARIDEDHGGILQQEEARQGYRECDRYMERQWWTVILRGPETRLDGVKKVDKARFELATSALRRQRSTGLIYLPI